jgi:hypothetical protein
MLEVWLWRGNDKEEGHEGPGVKKDNKRKAWKLPQILGLILLLRHDIRNPYDASKDKKEDGNLEMRIRLFVADIIIKMFLVNGRGIHIKGIDMTRLLLLVYSRCSMLFDTFGSC